MAQPQTQQTWNDDNAPKTDAKQPFSLSQHATNILISRKLEVHTFPWAFPLFFVNVGMCTKQMAGGIIFNFLAFHL